MLIPKDLSVSPSVPVASSYRTQISSYPDLLVRVWGNISSSEFPWHLPSYCRVSYHIVSLPSRIASLLGAPRDWCTAYCICIYFLDVACLASQAFWYTHYQWCTVIRKYVCVAYMYVMIYPYLFAQLAHNFFQRIACDIDHLTQEDNLPREKLWLQTKFTAIRGQDPRRVPYDPQALIGWDCLPGVAPFSLSLLAMQLSVFNISLIKIYIILICPKKTRLRCLCSGEVSGTFGNAGRTIDPTIVAKFGHILHRFIGDAFTYAHLGRELGGLDFKLSVHDEQWQWWFQISNFFSCPGVGCLWASPGS